MSSAPRHDSASPYIWMLVGQFAFAIMGTLAHLLAGRCSWQVIALWRTLVPLTLVGLYAYLAGVRLVLFGRRSLWIRSLSGSISLVCTFFAFTRLPVSDVLTITNLFPIWVALLGWPVLGHRPTLTTWLAIACGLYGVVLLQQPQFAQGNLAALAALTSSFCSAVAMLGLNRLQEIDTRAIVFHFSGVSMMFCWIAFFTQTPVTDGHLVQSLWPGSNSYGLQMALTLLGVGASAMVGQICLTKAFTTGVPAKVSVIGLTQVGFSMAFEVVFFHRQFSQQTLMGMLLILAPTAWLMMHVRPVKRLTYDE